MFFVWFFSFLLGRLVRPTQILQIISTNLRNRPLSRSNIDSIYESIPSLYHSLVTGSKDFPLIPVKGLYSSRLMFTPFPHSRQSQRENTPPSPLTEEPVGLMVPTAGSSSPPPNILTTVLPEKTEIEALKADRRNCVRSLEFDGSTVTRVISTVYRTESAELTNCWRVTDYTADGHLLMSVLCRFTKVSTKCAKTPKQGKRKDTEEESSSSSSSLSPPKKRLRV